PLWLAPTPTNEVSRLGKSSSSSLPAFRWLSACFLPPSSTIVSTHSVVTPPLPLRGDTIYPGFPIYPSGHTELMNGPTKSLGPPLTPRPAYIRSKSKSWTLAEPRRTEARDSSSNSKFGLPFHGPGRSSRFKSQRMGRARVWTWSSRPAGQQDRRDSIE